jgi:hypothetical protein
MPAAVSAGPIEVAIEYYSRLALSQPPRPREPVVVDYPYFDGADDHYVGEFDVFIDDTGGVVQVTPATPNLPGILVNAVREAFLAARFAPGELQGRPGDVPIVLVELVGARRGIIRTQLVRRYAHALEILGELDGPRIDRQRLHRRAHRARPISGVSHAGKPTRLTAPSIGR